MLDILREIDHWLFRLINIHLSNPVFDVIMPFVTNEHNWIIPLVLVWMGLMIFGKRKGRIVAITVVVAVGITDALLAQVIKPLIGRIRPSHVLESVNLLMGKGGKYSFPSNHAANISAAMTIFIIYYPKYRVWFIAVVIVVSLSRIYVGVHYPFDVLGGIIMGCTISLITVTAWLLITNHFDKKRMVE